MAVITHKQWAVATIALRDAVGNQVAPACRHIVTSLRGMGFQAQSTVVRQGEQVSRVLDELGQDFARLEVKYSTLFRPINEAQKAAGGLGEVAGRKQYNRR